MYENITLDLALIGLDRYKKLSGQVIHFFFLENGVIIKFLFDDCEIRANG